MPYVIVFEGVGDGVGTVTAVGSVFVVVAEIICVKVQVHYLVRIEVIELSLILPSSPSNVSPVNKLVGELLIGFPMNTVQEYVQQKPLFRTSYLNI